MRIDLHTHTQYSKDSLCSPRSLLKAAVKRGMGGVAITDHDSCSGWADAKAAGKEFGIIVIKGEEVKTTSGELMALFIEEPIRSREPAEVIDEIRAQAGLVIMPHPFDRGYFKEVGKFSKKIHGIETLNARFFFIEQMEKAEELARKLKVATVGGSDAHSKWEVGSAYTIADADDAEGVRKAILNRRTEVGGSLVNPLFRVGTFLIKKSGLKHVARFLDKKGF